MKRREERALSAGWRKEGGREAGGGWGGDPDIKACMEARGG